MEERFERTLIELVEGIFKEHKIRGNDAAAIVKKKILPAEVQQFQKTKKDWRDFKVNGRTSAAVRKFVMNNYITH